MLRAASAAVSIQASQRKRMTPRIMAVINRSESLELVVGVDEEAAEGHHLLACFQASPDLRIQLTLKSRLNLTRIIAALVHLHINDLLAVGFDDGLVRNGQHFQRFGHD